MRVLITGAAGGLGRALAVECARRGYRLFLTDRNAQALCHIQDGLCRQFGVQVTAVPCDLTDSASVDAMLDQIDRAQMQFDMLLNVAGLDYEGAFLGCQRENIVQIVALNDAATLRITHAVLQRRSPPVFPGLCFQPGLPFPHAPQGHLRRLQAVPPGFCHRPAPGIEKPECGCPGPLPRRHGHQ